MLSAKLHQLVVDQLPASDRIIWTYNGSVDDKNRLYLPMGLAKQLDLDHSKEFTSIFIDWKQPFLSLIPNKQRGIVEDVLAKMPLIKNFLRIYCMFYLVYKKFLWMLIIGFLFQILLGLLWFLHLVSIVFDISIKYVYILLMYIKL